MTGDPVFQYLQGQLRPGHPALIARFEQDSAEAVATLAPELDLRYAPHPRAGFDFFRAAGPARGTLLYFHAGYWQSRDKSTFRFLAPALVARGLNVALANYPLCPDVDLATLVETAKLAVPVVMRHGGGAPLIVAGHSAGAQLAIEILLAAPGAAWPGTIASALCISGVYDLEPLLPTPLNDRLRLDVATARAHSPIHRVAGGMPPARFVVGGGETPAFLAQNADMHAAWVAKGNPGTNLVVPGADHFTVLESPMTWAGI